MRRFPAEFEDLLSPRGRRVLAGGVAVLDGPLADPEAPFLAVDGLIRPDLAVAAPPLLARSIGPHLSLLAQGIPPDSISGQTRNHQERLRKTVRVRTAYLERPRSRAWQAADSIGLIAMLRSGSFHAFAERLAGRALAPRPGVQVLCYGPGDYAGPHTDHHPEDPRAAGGYVDVHLGFAGPGVAHQYLVYARDGHLCAMAPVHRPGCVTAYRLPLWHYATPLAARRGREREAQRWVALGTFYLA